MTQHIRLNEAESYRLQQARELLENLTVILEDGTTVPAYIRSTDESGNEIWVRNPISREGENPTR